MTTNKLPDKWVTASALIEILAKKGHTVAKSTVSHWIRKKMIPTYELVGGKTVRYLVDKTNVPPIRQRGRPFADEARKSVKKKTR